MKTLLFILCLALGIPCLAQVLYTEQSSSAGIDHSYPVHMGAGGISFVDFNQDGWDDLTMATGPGESIHFYQNNNGNFEQIDLIDTEDLIKSVLWVDYNNDGLKDLYVVRFDNYNQLFKNQGSLNLVEVTASAGLPLITKRCFGATFGDVNRDGWLDLYYVERRTSGESAQNQMRLFMNNADGTFTDESFERNAADQGRLPFCSAFFDFDNDKWPDIYIANDKLTQNTFLQSNQGTYIDRSSELDINFPMNAMCVALGDVDKNGFMDVYVTNTEEGSILLRNNQGESFDQVAQPFGVSFEEGIGWGANFVDADNDGWVDLYVSGMIEGADEVSSAFYRNLEGELFDEPGGGFLGDTVSSYNNAIGDYNNDGYADIAVINWMPHKSHLWKNQSTQNNNWIKVNLEGVFSNRDGIGASVCVYSNGLAANCQFTTCGIGFLAQNSENLIFGLGEAVEVDSVVVVWPTGHRDVLINPNINELHEIEEGSTTSGTITVDDDIEIISVLPYFAENEYSSLEISPNPAKEVIYIQELKMEGKLEYKIMSSAGKLMKEGNLTAQSLSVGQLPSGKYYLIIKHDEINHKGSFIKI